MNLHPLARCALFFAATWPVFGCTQLQIFCNALHQTPPSNAIYQKQVLNNLAMFVQDPYAVPSFAVPLQDTSQVGETTGLATTSGAIGLGFWNLLSGYGSQQQQNTWILKPVSDPAKLMLMRCAYQRAIGMMSEPCIDCCKLEQNFHGSGKRQIQVFDTKHAKNKTIPTATAIKHDPGTHVPFTDPLTGTPFVIEGFVITRDDSVQTGDELVQVDGVPDENEHWEPKLSMDPRTMNPQVPYVYNWHRGNVSIPQHDCNGPCAIHTDWFCYSNYWWDVPMSCRTAYGSYKGTYVWVPLEYRGELAKLTFTILDYAVNSPPPPPTTKSVVVYLDENGLQTGKDKHTKEVTTTIHADASEQDLREALGLPIDNTTKP